MASVETDIDKYDFFELKVYDIHGYSKGRIVSRSRMQSVIDHGMGLYGAICFYGVRGQPNTHPAFLGDMAFANYRVCPLLSTLKPCQRAAYGDRKVASVLCELRYQDGTLETCAPREVAICVLRQLESEFGLKLHSSFEAEFGIRDAKTGKPLAHENRWCSVTAMQIGQAVLMDLLDSMQEIGVRIDTLMSELGPGQFEVTFDVAEGIAAADMATEFKLSSYVFTKEKGYDAEFMTSAHPNIGCSNGFHFNFSLWDSNGKNVFVANKNGQRLSDFGQHFLAGILEHASAMTAFCSPTINCYRRIGTPFAPTFANWASENRESTIRLKNEPEDNVFLENRLPSSACSPHLVMACTLAAGMDGVRRKLELPVSMEDTKRLPATLDEALDALEADTLLRETLGSKFVDLFIFTKRKFECDEFKAFGELSEEEQLLKEKEYYYDPL